jgi:hypothetical protein
MKIKHNPNSRIVRTTKAPHEFIDDKGELTAADITVEYYSPTLNDIEQSRLKVEASNGGIEWLADELSQRVHRLPEIVGEDDEPVKVTPEFLRTLTMKNLFSIQEAINAALNPKSDAAK